MGALIVFIWSYATLMRTMSNPLHGGFFFTYSFKQHWSQLYFDWRFQVPPMRLS
jgi:hypothetical protein